MHPPAPVPAQKSKPPWWRRWWSITIAAVLLLGCVGALIDGGGDGDDTDTAGEADESASAAEGTEAAETGSAEATEEAEEAEEAEPERPADWFEAATHSGSGDEVIALPEGAVRGMVTAVYTGGSNFIVDVLDEHNEMTGDLLVNTVGSYEGTTAFGLLGFGGDPAQLQVTASGDWEITVAHLDTAPMLELPAEGRGDAVFNYSAGAATWTLTHDGSSNFIVSSTEGFGPLVNEIGTYEGDRPVTGGEAVITVKADGNWSISAA